MELSAEGIPIIDVALAVDNSSKKTLVDVAKHVANACQDAGCFYITNHGIDYSLRNSLFRDFRCFFDQLIEYKLKYKLDFSLDRGYFPFETQNVNRFMGRPNLPNDPVEKLAFGPFYECSRSVPENVWPDKPASLKENVQKYYLSMRDLADVLARIFAIALGIEDENYFYQSMHNAAHSMKGNFYPGNSKPKHMQTTRFPEHFDITPFTILTSDNCPNSLRVKNANGEWVYANPVSGALFVNLGDVMQRWTNDKWKATMHKVVWPEGDDIPDRQTIAFFTGLNPDTVIECIPSCCQEGQSPKYEPILYDDYMNAPMKRLSGY